MREVLKNIITDSDNISNNLYHRFYGFIYDSPVTETWLCNRLDFYIHHHMLEQDNSGYICFIRYYGNA